MFWKYLSALCVVSHFYSKIAMIHLEIIKQWYISVCVHNISHDTLHDSINSWRIIIIFYQNLTQFISFALIWICLHIIQWKINHIKGAHNVKIALFVISSKIYRLNVHAQHTNKINNTHIALYFLGLFMHNQSVISEHMCLFETAHTCKDSLFIKTDKYPAFFQKHL